MQRNILPDQRFFDEDHWTKDGDLVLGKEPARIALLAVQAILHTREDIRAIIEKETRPWSDTERSCRILQCSQCPGASHSVGQTYDPVTQQAALCATYICELCGKDDYLS